jgi:hypothetical protein
MEVLIQKHHDQENSYHYMVLNLNKDVMENLVTIAQGWYKAMIIISLSVKNEIIPYIQNINDLAKAWEKLQSLFDIKSTTKRLMFCNKLQGICMEEGVHMNKFFLVIKALIIQLANIGDVIN